ncbi:YchJ family protein [Agrobacterium tumefaciens]|uniref:YchJ family protein n=1 Tax=Agrobacterium tumefaciens TaxID=358 RepID=UPI00157216D6|nr:hypothetical protein [Agrobacterium tumefaciens]NTD11701.1 hypothetical protein [Agrobacterium tumefaciens]
MSHCPCGSSSEFGQCCEPLIKGAPATSPEALMRSRYTAFTLGDLDYIEGTCTEEALRTLNRADLERSLPDMKWLEMKVRETSGGNRDDKHGSVTFSFRYTYGGREHSQTELARFVRRDRWLYDGSEINPKGRPVRVESIGRNDPCPCGSGKKYKKCCGAGT